MASGSSMQPIDGKVSAPKCPFPHDQRLTKHPYISLWSINSQIKRAITVPDRCHALLLAYLWTSVMLELNWSRGQFGKSVKC